MGCCDGKRGKQNIDYQDKKAISCEEAVTKLSETSKHLDVKFNVEEVILLLIKREIFYMIRMVY